MSVGQLEDFSTVLYSSFVFNSHYQRKCVKYNTYLRRAHYISPIFRSVTKIMGCLTSDTLNHSIYDIVINYGIVWHGL